MGTIKKDCIKLENNNEDEYVDVHDHWIIMVSYDSKKIDIEEFKYSEKLDSIMYEIECDLPKNTEIRAAVVEPLENWLKVHNMR